MPKYSREMEDKIIALFEQGKRNSVISRELSIYRGALPSRRKEWEKRKQEQEKQETEPEKVKPTDPWATLSQISELEKRMSKFEESQRESKQSFDKLLLNFEKMRKEPLESVKRKLEKRIIKIEKSQREPNLSLLENWIKRLEEMRKELLESAERRLKDDDACKHIGNKGFCHLHYFSYEEVKKAEYLKPVGYSEKNGKKVYYINVKKHPLICSACPDYEPKR